jgi:hypothetical protein
LAPWSLELDCISSAASKPSASSESDDKMFLKPPLLGRFFGAICAAQDNSVVAYTIGYYPDAALLDG